MDSRREFLKKAAMLSGAAGIAGMLPASIQKALAINPETGSTYLDAEHIVILMQENRSFDHCFGALQGVRGFNDPRAIKLPNQNKVWYQTNDKGETYAPFRLNIKDTKATWMGSLPHGWTDQTDARNGGKYDQWLQAKKSGHPDYKDMPLTLGYYNREDLPFYYSLADAFTICDQNFCSSLTGTTPNRLHLWTGTIRDENKSTAQARVRNSELDYDVPAHWTTFPERLEEHGVSWKIYQNELSVGVGFEGEEDAWLSNFTDNPIEWFTQYHVKFHPEYIQYIPKRIKLINDTIIDTEKKLTALKEGSKEFAKAKGYIEVLKHWLAITKEDEKIYTTENYNKLTEREKSLHAKAFTTNRADVDYHSLTMLKYNDGATPREVQVPKGDTLYQFREDVKNGKLPTVSWLVAPENFSDHPGAPWYGAWYVSEAMDILTSNPEVWKKTIFILCYDENDGYFDHVPPFVAPNPAKPESGLVSKGIDASVEYVTREQDEKRNKPQDAREGPIGLGYRVPLIVASPWSRGGVVNSQVFDHTSIIQLVEKFLSHKTGKKIEEANISAWRRTVCGDLTTVFQPYNGEKVSLLAFLQKEDTIETVHKAKYKDNPSGYRALSPSEITQGAFMPAQEKGVRISSALPYELYAEAHLTSDKKSVEVKLQASKEVFGAKASGAPFHIYANTASGPRAYAVKAGDELTDHFPTTIFPNGMYELEVHGPNGFYRAAKGDSNDPQVAISAVYEKNLKTLTGNIELKLTNISQSSYKLTITDNAYSSAPQSVAVEPGKSKTVRVELSKSFGWYDFTVAIEGAPNFHKQYAGRVETGKSTYTDPQMGASV